MFTGEHEHTIDDKSRVTLPARFRPALQDGVVLSRGLDGQIDVYPREVWATSVQARLEELDPFSREARDLRRFLVAGAAEDTPDKQGRVLVPPALVRHAHLEKDVVVAGLDDHLELWDRPTWEDRLKAVEGSIEDVAERLAENRR